MPARLNRRSFLAGSAASVLIACSRTSKRTQTGQDVVVANHPFYVDASTNRDFEAATGIHVDYHEEVTDDGAWLASVTPAFERGESIERDVVIVSEWVADRLARHGWLAETVSSSPEARVIWAMGMVGVAYDVRATGSDVREIAELFRPPLHGRVALPNDMRSALGMALLADHTDPATVTLAQATATAGRLANSVKLGQIAFVRDAIGQLTAGDAAAAVVRASDTVGLERDHPGIRFVVPDEGGLLLTDLAVLPVNAANPDGARRYVEFVNQPDRAAERFRVVPALWPSGPLDAQLRAIAPDVFNDPRRNPAPDVRARLHSFRLLSDDEDRAFAALFDGVIHAR